MRISDILARKGAAVVTVSPTTSASDLVAALALHHVGALVVTDASGIVVGVVSERDVVRRLYVDGADLLALTVSDLMSTVVRSCGPGASVDSVMATMTEHRVRHVPVLLEGALVGIVSIGDVVKHQMDQLQGERDQLTAYISG